MKTHIAYTWLWTNLLHQFILLLYFDAGSFSLSTDTISSLLQVMAYSLLFSLPALFFSQLAGYLISRMHSTIIIQFLLWVIVAPLIVLLNFLLVFLIGGTESFYLFELNVATPAIISVLLVVLLRYQSFFNACAPVSKEEPEQQDQIF
jgi:hypothetical protein